MSTRQTYSTSVEGGQRVQLRYTLSGDFDQDDLLAFVAERAAWLSLSGWAQGAAGMITMVVAGPEALVGAIEMALRLGPDDTLIEVTGPVFDSAVLAEDFRLLR